MIVVGEVHTALLQHSCALSERNVARVLALVAGDQVRQSTRPISHALSPELLTGLDCEMTGRSGRAARVVGTAVCRASVLGGHVLQGSTFTRISGEWDRQRQPWARYLAQPGVVRAVGKADAGSLAAGFVEPPSLSSPALKLGSVSSRTVDIVQRSEALDRRAPFRAARTRLRWAANLGGAGHRLTFTLADRHVRTLTVDLPDTDPQPAVWLAEDLAVHDWLLTTTADLVERARIGGRPRHETIDRLRPVIDHLTHLWTPTARLCPETEGLWQRLEQRPGLTRQWQALITRVRDQMTLATLGAPHNDGHVRTGM